MRRILYIDELHRENENTYQQKVYIYLWFTTFINTLLMGKAITLQDIGQCFHIDAWELKIISMNGPHTLKIMFAQRENIYIVFKLVTLRHQKSLGSKLF